jgi:protein TonB
MRADSLRSKSCVAVVLSALLWAAASVAQDAAPPTPPPVTRPEAARLSPATCKPAYPAESLRAGEQGATLLRFQLTAAGEAENIDVVRSSGSARLDEASIAAVRRCRFKLQRPPSGAASAPTFNVEYVWRLENDAPAVPLGPVAPDPYQPRL